MGGRERIETGHGKGSDIVSRHEAHGAPKDGFGAISGRRDAVMRRVCRCTSQGKNPPGLYSGRASGEGRGAQAG